MAGSRIEPPLLAKLTGRRSLRCSTPAPGSAWWYLALKNWVIASGVHPRCTFHLLPRHQSHRRRSSAAEGAIAGRSIWWRSDREDEVNAVLGAARRGTALPGARGGRSRLRHAPRRATGSSRPSTTGRRGPMFAYRRPRADVHAAAERAFRPRSHLRPMEAADMQATEDREADFDRFVDNRCCR